MIPSATMDGFAVLAVLDNRYFGFDSVQDQITGYRPNIDVFCLRGQTGGPVHLDSKGIFPASDRTFI